VRKLEARDGDLTLELSMTTFQSVTPSRHTGRSPDPTHYRPRKTVDSRFSSPQEMILKSREKIMNFIASSVLASVSPIMRRLGNTPHHLRNRERHFF
jgi:hypothetical protein